jgi:hypothetical protein
MTKDEALKLAMKALQMCTNQGMIPMYLEKNNEAIAAIKEALAQPEQEPVAHTVIAGALFDFMGYLTSRKERIVLSAADDAAPAADAIRDFATKRGLSLDDAQVREWIDAYAQPEQEPTCPECKAAVLYECVACSSNNYPPAAQRPWVGLTDDEVYKIAFALEGEHWRKVADAIEAKLKEKNT